MVEGPFESQDLDKGELPLNVTTLSEMCQLWAEMHDPFFPGKGHPVAGDVAYWTDENLFEWLVEVKLEHTWDEGRYLGIATDIGMTVMRKLPHVVCAEAQDQAALEDVIIPKRYLHGSQLQHAAQYTITPYDTLGWDITRSHILEFKKEALGLKVPGMIATKHNTAELSFVTDRDQVLAEMLPLELSDDPAQAVFERSEIDMRLEQATRIFDMLISRNSSEFEIDSLFPREVLEQL